MNSAIYELGRRRARSVIADGTLLEWLKMPLEKIGADYERGFMDVVCGVGKAAGKAKK